MRNLFGEEVGEANKKPNPMLFCGKWTLDQATAKMLDMKFQESKAFPKLLSELYAYSFCCKSSALFDFLETRFNRNIIQDKEIHLHFEVVNSREEANS